MLLWLCINRFIPEAQRVGVSARFHTSLFESKIKGAKQTGRAAGCNRCGRGIA